MSVQIGRNDLSNTIDHLADILIEENHRCLLIADHRLLCFMIKIQSKLLILKAITTSSVWSSRANTHWNSLILFFLNQLCIICNGKWVANKVTKLWIYDQKSSNHRLRRSLGLAIWQHDISLLMISYFSLKKNEKNSVWKKII